MLQLEGIDVIVTTKKQGHEQRKLDQNDRGDTSMRYTLRCMGVSPRENKKQEQKQHTQTLARYTLSVCTSPPEVAHLAKPGSYTASLEQKFDRLMTRLGSNAAREPRASGWGQPAPAGGAAAAAQPLPLRQVQREERQEQQQQQQQNHHQQRKQAPQHQQGASASAAAAQGAQSNGRRGQASPSNGALFNIIPFTFDIYLGQTAANLAEELKIQQNGTNAVPSDTIYGARRARNSPAGLP